MKFPDLTEEAAGKPYVWIFYFGRFSFESQIIGSHYIELKPAGGLRVWKLISAT